MKKIDHLTDVKIARFPEFVDRWTTIGLCTDPADRPRAEAGIATAYRMAGLDPPKLIVWCGSPLSQGLTRAIVFGLAGASASVGDSVGDSVWDSVGDSVRDSVGASVRDARTTRDRSGGRARQHRVWALAGPVLRRSDRRPDRPERLRPADGDGGPPGEAEAAAEGGGVVRTATRKLRSPLKWHGGKSYLARRIIARLPEHETYVEPFIGGGSVLLNKPPAAREVAGDLNAGLIQFWYDLQQDKKDPARYPFNGDSLEFLPDLVDLLGYNEGVFLSAKEGRYAEARPRFGPSLDFLIRNRFSRGGLGKDFAWSDRLRGGQPGDANAWETIKGELPAIVERVRRVEFHCCDAVQLIRSNDSIGTLFYCDPPYLSETRTVKKAYQHEMTRDDHAALLGALKACRGMVFLSGYRNPIYDEVLAGWKRIDFEIANHSGQGKTKQRRVECLWTNAEARA